MRKPRSKQGKQYKFGKASLRKSCEEKIKGGTKCHQKVLESSANMSL